MQPTRQTSTFALLDSDLFIYLFFSCSALQFAKHSQYPEKLILFFKARRVHEFQSPNAIDVVAPSRHPYSEAVSSGGSSGAGGTDSLHVDLWFPCSCCQGIEAQGSPCSAQLLILLSPVTSSLSRAVALFTRRHTSVICQPREQPSW